MPPKIWTPVEVTSFAQLAAPAFGDRNQQIQPGLVGLASLRIGMMPGHIHVHGDHVVQGAHRLDLRLHRHQHPADIGMIDDRHPVAAAGTLHRIALHPLLGVASAA